MEYDGDVGFDGDSGVVAAREGVFQDVADATLAFAGVVVVAIVFRGNVCGVFYVNVGDVIADVFPELPGVLTGPGRWTWPESSGPT